MPPVQYQATGRRKRAVARVILRPGKGAVKINGREVQDYLNTNELWIGRALEPLATTANAEKFDVLVNTHGGGLKGQSEAIRLGIARALVLFDAGNRELLKPQGMLTRDPRKVERKHYYKRKARKSPQYSKR